MGTVFLKWSRMTALYKSAAQAQFAVKSTFRLWMKMSLNIYRLCNEAFIVHDRQLVRQSFQLMRKHHSYTNCNRQIADAAASSHLKYRWFTRWRAHFDKRGKCVSMQKLHMKSRLSSAFKCKVQFS
jgi:hypothetical protein